MGERAPISITFYLSRADAELFAALYAARMGERYDERVHDKLIEAGFLEIDKFNPGPNGECLDDVELSTKGKGELHRLAKLSAAEFESKRRDSRARKVPDCPANDLPSRRPVLTAEGRGFPAGRASRPVPQGNPHRESLAGTQAEEKAHERSTHVPTIEASGRAHADAHRAALPGEVPQALAEEGAPHGPARTASAGVTAEPVAVAAARDGDAAQAG